MPDNKKHHFVPRFYLKRFSSDGRSISLLNIKNNMKIGSANLKNQCYKDYFYGQDLKVEKSLGIVENHAANILRLIDEYQTLPPYDSEDYIILVLYVLMQHSRTTYSVDVLNDMSDKLMKHLVGPKAAAEGIDLSKFTIGLKEPAQYSLGIVSQSYPLLLDLACKLILNATSTDFVTSDNPVVLYNQLLSFRNHGSNTGFTSKGLQIVFPISSKKLLIFYDHESYSVGRASEPFVNVTCLRDVYELNTLQMTSAYENVYFKNSEFDIEPLVRKASPFRRNKKSNMSIFPGEETESTRSEFIASSREDIRTNLVISFIRVKKSTKTWRTKFKKQKTQPAVVVRNREFVDEHDKFLKKVESGEYKYGDFFTYLSQRHEK